VDHFEAPYTLHRFTTHNYRNYRSYRSYRTSGRERDRVGREERLDLNLCETERLCDANSRLQLIGTWLFWLFVESLCHWSSAAADVAASAGIANNKCLNIGEKGEDMGQKSGNLLCDHATYVPLGVAILLFKASTRDP